MPGLSPFLILLAAAALTAATPLPAGDSLPTIIRTATVDGLRGPAYYSVVDGRFRAVSPPEQKIAELGR